MMLDATEKLIVLLHQEKTLYEATDYLVARSGKRQKHNQKPTDQQLNRMKWRKTCCIWAYQVSEFFDLDREIVTVAMSHMDRYVATFPKHTAIDKNCFQLAAMTSFYLAIKLTHSKILWIRGSNSTLETISMLSERRISVEEIEQMELEMLDRLQWHVHPPTPHAFLKQFMELMHIFDDEVYERARFLIEESTKEYCFLLFPPSDIAAAALWNAMEMLSISTTKIDELSLPKHSFDIHCTSIQACRTHLSRILGEQDDGIIGENGSPCQSPASVMRGEVEIFTSPASIRDPFTI